MTDYARQIFASQAVGGVIGNVPTGLFAQASVAGFDGFSEIPGGWLAHNYIQLGYQIADSVAGMSYSFVLTVSPILPPLRRAFATNTPFSL